jgi:hypothetical protein
MAQPIKKITLGRKMMEVIDEEEYRRRSRFDNLLFDDSCIEMNGMVYPVQKKFDPTVPGVYDVGPCLKYVKPTENADQYRSENITDFGKPQNFKDLIDQQDHLRKGREAILTTKENKVFNPKIAEDDTPELSITKEAIILKDIDIESYRTEFGLDYPNILRLFKDPKNKNITINRMKTVCNAMDIEMTVTLKDKKNAINPMGKELSVILTRED